MDIRVDKETLKKQLEMIGQLDFLEIPYHQAILNDEIRLSSGCGIKHARTYMLLLRKAHLGEARVTVWLKSSRRSVPRRTYTFSSESAKS